MKIKSHILIWSMVVSGMLLFLFAVVFPSNVLRLIIGIPYILFVPGYVLTVALYPRNTGLTNLERILLSVGLSTSIIILIGLLLNFLPWGINVYSVTISIIIFILIISAISLFRIKSLQKSEGIEYNIVIHRFKKSRGKLVNYLLTCFFICSILFFIGATIYFINNPKTNEEFAEFYILGSNGKANDYPVDLVLGQQGQVTIGVINKEPSKTEYTIETNINSGIKDVIGPISLQDGQKWEQAYQFVADQIGDDQQIEFVLYKNGVNTPYLDLYLKYNVSGTSGN